MSTAISFFNRLGLGSPKEFNALKPEERLARVREALLRVKVTES